MRSWGLRAPPAWWTAGLVVALAAICAEPAAARDGCVTLAPGADGVLRLDRPRAPAWPCPGPVRVYAALPPYASAGVPSPRSPPRSSSRPEPGVNAALPPAAAAEDIQRLSLETARLEADLARLDDETVALRAETRRLRDELSRRDAAAVDGPAPDTTQGAAPPVPSTPDAAGPADEIELARRKSVVERALGQLRDLAARMRKDLSGAAQ